MQIEKTEDVPNKQKQGKTSEKYLSEAEIKYLSDDEFKVMVINIVTKPRRTDGHSENSTKT